MLPRGFLELGFELMERGGPANTRTAMSRLYYAVHLEAMRLARSRGFVPRGVADDHGALVRLFEHGRLSWISGKLATLRSARNHADYHVERREEDCDYCKTEDLEFLPADVTSLRNDAEWLFTRLENTRPR